MLDRLYRNWVYGGVLAAILILCLTPLLVRDWSWAMIGIFLQLPVYMLHQYEEHDDDRFGRFINGTLGDGRVVLSDAAIFVINIPGVWGVNALSIWLAATVHVGYGLIGIYLTLVNALAHVGGTIALRRYNPGLFSAVVLFVPAGIWGLVTVSSTPGVVWGHHLIGLGSALAIHAAIIGYVNMNRRRLFAGRAA